MKCYITDPAEAELLASLCEKQETRRLFLNSADYPTRWEPHLVYVPRTAETFTDPGSWQLIAQLIREKHAIEIKALKKGVGGTGFEMKVALEAKKPLLYVKLTFNRKRTLVIGLSFHYSN